MSHARLLTLGIISDGKRLDQKCIAEAVLSFIERERELCMTTILQIFSIGSYRGGAAFSMSSLARELESDSHIRVVVLLPKTKDREIATQLEENGIQVYEMPLPWITHSPDPSSISGILKSGIRHTSRSLRTPHVNRKISRILEDEDIDLVHICDGVLEVGAIPAEHVGIPVMWHFREYVELDHGDVYDNKTRSFNTFSRAAGAITVSKALRDHYANLLPGVPIHVVYNGIAPRSDILARRKYIDAKSGNRDRVRLLFLGGIRDKKGIFEIVASLKQLQARGVPPFELDIYGPVFKEDKARFDKEISELGLQEIINYRGWAKVDLDFVSKYDMELTCSRSEAFGRVTAEAMSARTAVIGASTGGTTELLDEDRGYLYKQGNVGSLTDAIEYAICGEKHREEVIENAYNFACEHFTIERYAHDVKGVYEDILSRN